jgi:hypothetical protein
MEHNPFDRNNHREFPRKQKGNALAEQFGHRPLSLFHRWIILILGYVVRLEGSFILDGGDLKLILRRGFGHVE